MALSLAIALISAAALGSEILLVRFFAIIHWHHFAFMIISLALLGYGASGTFLFFARGRMGRDFEKSFFYLSALFSVSIPVAFALAQTIPLNTLEILWDPRQVFLLALQFLVLALPFFLGACAIGLALYRVRDRIGTLYRADLIGAGAGAIGIMAAMFVAPPHLCLKLVAGCAVIAAVIAAREWRGSRIGVLSILTAATLIIVILPNSWITPTPSPYKAISQSLLVPGRQIIAERFGPLGTVSVVSPGSTPFRYVPGLSLSAPVEPPPQMGLYVDGGGFSALTRYPEGGTDHRYLDFTTNALPFQLLHRPTVLILGAGGGSDVLRAVEHKARFIDVVEVNSALADLLVSPNAGLGPNVFTNPRVRLHISDARAFVAASEDRYDLIQLSLVDSPGAASSGLRSLSASTLYTVEAVGEYLKHLSPEGMLIITRWLKAPPRDSLKLIATATEALEGLGIDDTAARIGSLRGWMTTTVVVKREPFSDNDLAKIRKFCEERSFDIGFLPGIGETEVNRFNILERPYLFEGANALLGPKRKAFIDRYKFNIRPATDDRPFFFHFMKWEVFAEFIAMASAGRHLVEWGIPVSAATLVLATILSLIVILLPLAGRKDARAPLQKTSKMRFAAYFLALGMAFLLVELAFIQRFTLFLGHPVYSITVILASFLVFAGLGSGASPRISRTFSDRRELAIIGAVIAISGFSCLYVFALPVVFDWFQATPTTVRIAVSVSLIAPLSFFLGMPFPLGLAETGDNNPGLIPWAWGMNGCASVFGAALAPLLAMQIGFSGVVFVATAFYAIAAAAFASPKRLFNRYPRPQRNYGDGSP